MRAGSALERLSDLYARDLTHQDRPRVARLDHNVPDLIFIGHTAHTLNEVLLSSGKSETRRRIAIGPPKCSLHFAQCDVVFAQSYGIDQNLILFLSAASSDDLRNSRDGQETAAEHCIRGGADLERRVPI